MRTSAASRWSKTRTFHHSAFSVEELAKRRRASVSVCLPARECASTIEPIVRALDRLRRSGVLDQVLVVDAASADGTAELAAAAGAEVWQEAELMEHYGPVLGKGDAMWRALSVVRSDIVCFIDADIGNFSEHFALGLLGPLICAPGHEEIAFVKALYRRPFTAGGISLPEGGGRVNHLTARPVLALLYPDLAGVRQPLAGEVAARRALLERIPFTTGYGVEMAMLIDVYREAGLHALAQVDLDEHVNVHQALSALTPMAYAVLLVVARRLEAEGRLSSLHPGPLIEGLGAEEQNISLMERPPMVTVGSGGTR